MIAGRIQRPGALNNGPTFPEDGNNIALGNLVFTQQSDILSSRLLNDAVFKKNVFVVENNPSATFLVSGGDVINCFFGRNNLTDIENNIIFGFSQITLSTTGIGGDSLSNKPQIYFVPKGSTNNNGPLLREDFLDMLFKGLGVFGTAGVTSQDLITLLQDNKPAIVLGNPEDDSTKFTVNIREENTGLSGLKILGRRTDTDFDDIKNLFFAYEQIGAILLLFEREFSSLQIGQTPVVINNLKNISSQEVFTTGEVTFKHSGYYLISGTIHAESLTDTTNSKKLQLQLFILLSGDSNRYLSHTCSSFVSSSKSEYFLNFSGIVFIGNGQTMSIQLMQEQDPSDSIEQFATLCDSGTGPNIILQAQKL